MGRNPYVDFGHGPCRRVLSRHPVVRTNLPMLIRSKPAQVVIILAGVMIEHLAKKTPCLNSTPEELGRTSMLTVALVM